MNTIAYNAPNINGAKGSFYDDLARGKQGEMSDEVESIIRLLYPAYSLTSNTSLELDKSGADIKVANNWLPSFIQTKVLDKDWDLIKSRPNGTLLEYGQSSDGINVDRAGWWGSEKSQSHILINFYKDSKRFDCHFMPSLKRVFQQCGNGLVVSDCFPLGTMPSYAGSRVWYSHWIVVPNETLAKLGAPLLLSGYL